MIVNENKIIDKNNDEAVHPSDDLADNDYSNIKDHKIEQGETNRNSFTCFLIKNYNRALI